MKRRDRRFRAYRTYLAHGVKWTRSVNLAKERMTWTCHLPHPVRIERNQFGQYRLTCDEHKQFASTWHLRRAFSMAAVHMKYAARRKEPFVHRDGCQGNSACQCPPL